MTADRRTILLVDDSEASARLIQLTLELEGLTVEPTGGPDLALKLIAARMPDAIIMDYLMPGLSPGEFLARARDAGFTGKVLLCTAFDGPIDLDVDDRIQ